MTPTAVLRFTLPRPSLSVTPAKAGVPLPSAPKKEASFPHAEALGLHRGFPRVGPECVLGIELNPYAAELARVSVWIGEIQWMRRNGFDAAKNPILRPLDTIECRDAVLSRIVIPASPNVIPALSRDPPALASEEERQAPDQVRGDDTSTPPTQPAHPEEGLSTTHSAHDEEGLSEGSHQSTTLMGLDVEDPSQSTRRTTRAEWPAADVIIGNPPFLGSRYLRNGRPATRTSAAFSGLGDEYVDGLFSTYAGRVSQGANLVAYWFERAGEALQLGTQRVGLVATQAIRRGASRNVLQEVLNGGVEIYDAWSNEPWSQDGAQVRVSIICLRHSGIDGEIHLDGESVPNISADLRADAAQVQPQVLASNRQVAAQGTISGGPFEVPPTLARKMLLAPLNPNQEPNALVIRPWRNGDDLTDRPADWWIIDFGERRSEEEAALFEEPFRHLSSAWEEAQEQRRAANDKLLRAGEPRSAERWWVLQRRRSKLLRDLRSHSRYLATPRVSKHRFFVWVESSTVPDTRLVVFRRADDTFAGIVQSRIHEVWSLRFGANHGVGNDPEYLHTSTFETFPFPEGLTPDIPAADYAADPRAQKVAAAAARLNELRENWLNPPDLVVREPEVVAGFPDRILPKDEEAAKELKKRTLTNLYNARPQWLANAHAALDEAVAEAYGWGDDWRAGLLTDDEILSRLFRLNQERAG